MTAWFVSFTLLSSWALHGLAHGFAVACLQLGFRLARILQQQAQGERQIAIAREVLMAEPGFDVYQCFSLLNADRTGFVSRSNFIYFLKKHKFFVSLFSAFLFEKLKRLRRPMTRMSGI